MSTKVEFDETMARDVLASTLTQLLTPERKEQLLREAIVTVLTEKDKSSYGTENRLQNIFKQVVYDHAKERIGQLVTEDPELKAKLDAITRETVIAAFETVRDHISETITSALKQAMKSRW